MRRLATSVLLLAAALSILVALSLAGTARAAVGRAPALGNGLLSRLDPALQELIGLGSNATVDVIVHGEHTDKLYSKYARKYGELTLVGGVAARVRVPDLIKLALDPDISFVFADPTVTPQGNVDYSALATLYPKVDQAESLWQIGVDGTGVGVAVIDSGVAKMSDFGSRLFRVRLNGQVGSLDDTYGHGSLVAGVVGGQSPDGRFIGVAPRASLFAINVNSPEGVHTSDVIAGLQWVFDNAHTYNIRVVNLSLGETVAGSYQANALDLAVERLWAAGIVVVASAGNGGPGQVDYAPANDPLVLTVGASDTQGTMSSVDDTVASFSSNGVTRDGFAKPELYAPGRLIASVLPAGTTLDQQAPAANRVATGYAAISGTSFSAPQVSGAAALLLQLHPEWSPDNVKWFLTRTSRVLSGSAAAGALNLPRVVGSDRSPQSANQGVPALVCAPGSVCIAGGTVGTVSSSWNSSSWTSTSWNSSSWNSSSWNSSSWNSSSWNSSSWNSSSWNSSSWNSSSWNSSSWN